MWRVLVRAITCVALVLPSLVLAKFPAGSAEVAETGKTVRGPRAADARKGSKKRAKKSARKKTGNAKTKGKEAKKAKTSRKGKKTGARKGGKGDTRGAQSKSKRSSETKPKQGRGGSDEVAETTKRVRADDPAEGDTTRAKSRPLGKTYVGRLDIERDEQGGIRSAKIVITRDGIPPRALVLKLDGMDQSVLAGLAGKAAEIRTVSETPDETEPLAVSELREYVKDGGVPAKPSPIADDAAKPAPVAEDAAKDAPVEGAGG